MPMFFNPVNILFASCNLITLRLIIVNFKEGARAIWQVYVAIFRISEDLVIGRSRRPMNLHTGHHVHVIVVIHVSLCVCTTILS